MNTNIITAKKFDLEENKKQGCDILSHATKEQLNDAQFLYNLQKRYGLSLNGIIVEFCSDRLYNIINIANAYTDINEKDILPTIAKKDDIILKRPSKYRFDSTAEVLVDYFDIKEENVEQYIKDKNEENHQKQEEQDYKRQQEIENIVEEIKKPKKYYVSTIPVSMSFDEEENKNTQSEERPNIL